MLSIQDDEGYLRLTRRLAGLDVLMYMGANHTRLVKNSLGPEPGHGARERRLHLPRTQLPRVHGQRHARSRPGR